MTPKNRRLWLNAAPLSVLEHKPDGEGSVTNPKCKYHLNGELAAPDGRKKGNSQIARSTRARHGGYGGAHQELQRNERTSMTASFGMLRTTSP